MTVDRTIDRFATHDHVFLGKDHDQAARRTWAVIVLCSVMMIAEIVGGALFGSLALIADGLHMSTHAGALLLAALAYTYARKYANDRNFTFGTGKFGDLAGYSSAIVLAVIALLIGYEAVARFLSPVAISFNEAIPIAALGLGVNLASAWLLSGGHHGHAHGHSHGHDHAHDHGEDVRRIDVGDGAIELEVFENGVPPRFRLRLSEELGLHPSHVAIETARPDGNRQIFTLRDRGGYLESLDEIPEPHEFVAKVRLKRGERFDEFDESFEEHAHEASAGAHHRDNNMRAAVVHVAADAAVSVLVIVGLLLARAFGWLWMDPLAGLIGAVVIANWSFGLLRDTGGILLDRTPDPRMAEKVRRTIESDGDRVTDLHLWRLGPGHLGAIVSVETTKARGSEHYLAKLAADPNRRDHWENIYATKGENEVSWFEENPAPSLELIGLARLTPDSTIVDIGGGASRLVDSLIARGFRHVTVLDLSGSALNIAKARLGDKGGQVRWMVADVTTWEPSQNYDLWHDRAAFHFLTDEADRSAYVERLKKALRPGGHFIVGTFALDGPERCSRLPVKRSDAVGLAAILGDEFELVDTRSHEHCTPWGAVQRFCFSIFRRG
jgi:cation diffusion facilitator family transporter